MIPIPIQAKTGRRAMAKADFEALAQFRYQLRRFLRFSEQVAQAHGVTPLQYQLLLQIKGFPGRDWASVTELAERLQSKHHGVVALISRCESLGLVQRRASTNDLRQVEVRLTPSGERCVETLAGVHRDELESFQGLLAAPGPVLGGILKKG
jgi:DNA-binding MarR family transcriptional regulator